MTSLEKTIYAIETQMWEGFKFYRKVLKDLPNYSYVSYSSDMYPYLQVLDLKVPEAIPLLCQTYLG